MNFARASLQDFLCDEQGIAMTEAIIVVPFLTFLAISVLEFGSILWQRQQIETGLRDASRYMARCRHDANTCQGVARNLAYYGSSVVTTRERVRGWNVGRSPLTFTVVGDQVSVTTTHTVPGTPLFGALGIDNITVVANHNQRVIGW
jgi:Flp pilus assembly protein TadG